MSQKSSTFIAATRERETWLSAAADPANPGEHEGLLNTAALLRGTMDSIPVPEEFEERSRTRAVTYMQELRAERLQHTETRAPWYLRLGHTMRYVFTLGKKR